MDTAYNLPFEFNINGQSYNNFATKESDIYSDEFKGIDIFENDDVSIMFNSVDSDAKLYLDALDIVPNGIDVIYDKNGDPYRKVNLQSVPLFKNGGEYDALRVDSFRIIIVANNENFYSMLNVLPKQVSKDEWNIMKNDLEQEIIGLAQDLVRRNIGLGYNESSYIPPEKLYLFIVIHKYSQSILGALIDLKDKAKYQITKEYTKSLKDKSINIDSETVKRYLKKGSDDMYWDIPTKTITYDIQENRILKKILIRYEKILDEFIEILEENKKSFLSVKKFRNLETHYNKSYISSLDEFYDTANRLRKLTGIIKGQHWYKTVSEDKTGIIPHSFALDVRYGCILKMYQELINPKWNIKLDTKYSYSWKKSSSIYEMWCYIKLCKSFNQNFNLNSEKSKINFNNCMLFPFLEQNTLMSFEDDNLIINVIFDQVIPLNKDEMMCSKENAPFYTVGKNNRPDITINIYSKTTGNYIGSLILECKYRKLSSYWFDPYKSSQWNSGASSKPQILSYYNDSRSKFYRDNIIPNARPVEKVYVLTPDVNGITKSNKSSCGEGIINITLKPDDKNFYLNDLSLTIFSEIERMYEEEVNFTERINKNSLKN